MVCMNTSRLKTGRAPGVEGLVPERDFTSRSGTDAEAAGMYVGATLPGRCGSQSRAPAAEGLAPGQGESNPVQVKDFYRGEAEARRKREVADSVTERVEMSGGSRRGDSNLGGFAAWRDERQIFGAGRGESKLVQLKQIFPTPLGKQLSVECRRAAGRQHQRCFGCLASALRAGFPRL